MKLNGDPEKVSAVLTDLANAGEENLELQARRAKLAQEARDAGFPAAVVQKHTGLSVSAVYSLAPRPRPVLARPLADNVREDLRLAREALSLRAEHRRHRADALVGLLELGLSAHEVAELVDFNASQILSAVRIDSAQDEGAMTYPMFRGAELTAAARADLQPQIAPLVASFEEATQRVEQSEATAAMKIAVAKDSGMRGKDLARELEMNEGTLSLLAKKGRSLIGRPSPVPSEPDPASAQVLDDLKAVVEDLQALKTRQHALIRAADAVGMEPDAIAARLGTSTTAVRAVLKAKSGVARLALPELPVKHSAYDVRYAPGYSGESALDGVDLPGTSDGLLDADLAVRAAIARRASAARAALDAGADAEQLATEVGTTAATVLEWAADAVAIPED